MYSVFKYFYWIDFLYHIFLLPLPSKMTKFFDLKVQSAKEILCLSKKETSFFVLRSTFRNFAP